MDQGRPTPHGKSNPNVVAVARIISLVAVDEQTAGTDTILVGAWLAFHDRNRGDADRDLGQDGGLEDALGADQGDSGSIEGEADGEEGAREDAIGSALSLLGEKGKGGQPHPPIEVERAGIHSQPPPVSEGAKL